MGKVKVSQTLPGPISTAEALWYDVRRWPSFVDGFGHTRSVRGGWPDAGGEVLWQSTAGGRGLVRERATRYEVRSGQTTQVEDPRMTGEQVVTFVPGEEGEPARITVELRYRLKQRTPLTPLVDVLFVRRAMADALRRTLSRFAREVRGDLELVR